MEAVLWFCTVAALGVAYALSYSHQSGVFEQLDYSGWEHLAVPLALDLPLTASVAALYLSARWKSPWPQRWTYRGMTLLTAPLSLGANALHGSVHAGQVNWARVTEPVHLVSSLIPAAIVLACVIAAEVTFGEKARLDELAGRDGPTRDVVMGGAAEAPVGGPASPTGPTHERPMSGPDERPTAEPNGSAHPSNEPAHERPTGPAQSTIVGGPPVGPRAARRAGPNGSRGPAHGRPNGRPTSGPFDRPTVAEVAAHIRGQLADGRPLKTITKASVGREMGLARSTAQRKYDDALEVLRAEPDGPLPLSVVENA